MKDKSKFLMGGAIALAVGLGEPQAAMAVEQEAIRYVADGYTDRLIVKWRNGEQGKLARSGTTAMQSLSVTAGTILTHVRRMSGHADVVRLPWRMSIVEVDEIAARLSADPAVEYAVPDKKMYPLRLPNDPMMNVTEQWHFFGPSHGSPGGANLPAAWDITVGNPAVVVAVIDTGLGPHADIDSDILDGAGRVLPGYDFVSDPLMANDGDGRDADPTDPGDWVSAAESTDPDSLFFDCPDRNSSWHGTHVAGIIGALTDNGLGVAGVNWGSRILPVRVLGKCGGYMSDIIDGMRWAVGLSVPGIPLNPNPAHVLNLSLGGKGKCDPTFQEAIDEIIAAGKVIVVAAGNSNEDVNNSSPANCAGVIAVAAVGQDGRRAWYSNFGEGITISAPGGDHYVDSMVLSTANTGTQGPVASPDGDTYVAYEGTSMAAPHVSGIVSLMLSVKPSLTPAQIVNTLKATARPFPPYNTEWDCTTSICGAGIVNAPAAVQAISSGAPFADAGSDQTVDPGASVTLDGSGSSDDGVIVSYQWQQVGGIPVVLNNADQVMATFTAPRPAGLLRFSLTVTDDGGSSSTNIVNVTVSNVPPVLVTGGDRTVKAGEALNFTVTATDANGTTPVLSASGVPQGATFDPATGAFAWPSARPAGTYSVTFTATDGVNTVNKTVVITVEESGGGGGGVLDILVLLWTAGLLAKGFRSVRS